MLRKSVYLALLICCSVLPAAASNQSGAFTLSPFLGNHVFEGNQSLDTSSFWGVGLGYNLTENWAVEAVYSKTDADAEDLSTTDTKVETYHLDALYHFWPNKRFVPYIAAGLGAINSSPEGASDRDHLLLNYGAGFKYFILDDLIALRADVRHLVDFPEPDNNLQYSAGLTFQLGKSTPAPEPVVITETPVPAPVDRDGDGVVDAMDQCPNTPSGIKVDAHGCPLDSDNDGVYDDLDKCPGTTSGVAVDSNGCPLDSDDDGVFDSLDQCPGTPQGVSVDAKGCPTTLTLHINFGHDSNKAGPEYDGEIAKAAQCINEYPGNVVFIYGHTDSDGAAAYNQKLSEQRAAAVKNRLVEKFDISADRMRTQGFGEDQPVADNKATEGKSLNRRVEVACGAK
jgi:OOP family OmpA-OmpF porin